KGQLDPATTFREPTPKVPSPLLVLSRQDFDAAVRQALRDYTDLPALASSPLLRARVTAGYAPDRPTAATLRMVLHEAAESVRTNPRARRLPRALERTYRAPAATQEAAAEQLSLPFSTYRYQLAGAVRRVTDWLWRRELESD